MLGQAAKSDSALAYALGPYGSSSNGINDDTLAGYNPFNGPLLASGDAYSMHMGVHGPIGYTLNDRAISLTIAGQSTTQVIEVDGKEYTYTVTVGEPESLDANSQDGTGGDFETGLSPLQEQLMSTDPNSPQYAALQRQLYMQQY